MPFHCFTTLLAKCFVSLRMYSSISAEELRADLRCHAPSALLDDERDNQWTKCLPFLIWSLSESLFTNITPCQSEGITMIQLITVVGYRRGK